MEVTDTHQLLEIFRSQEDIQARLETSKQRIEAVLDSGFVPRPIHRIFRRSLRITQLVPDEEFFRLVLAVGNPHQNPLLTRHIQERVGSLNSVFVPSFTNEGKALIIIRSSVFEITPLTFMLTSLIAEEVGHSLSRVQRKALRRVDDSSPFLQPFPSKAELLAYLDWFRDQFGISSEPILPENIVVTTWGFRSFFRDRVQKYIYPSPEAAYIHEEARGAVIQTLLEAIMYGLESPRADGSMKSVFYMGMFTLKARAHRTLPSFPHLLEFFAREEAALRFINTYITEYSNGNEEATLAETLQSLLTLLYESNIEQFYEYLEEHPMLAAVYPELYLYTALHEVGLE